MHPSVEGLQGCKLCPVSQRSPTFWAPGSGFVEDDFFHGLSEGGWFGDDSSALHLLCTLFLLLLHQLHLRSSGIRSQRLGTYVLEYKACWSDTDFPAAVKFAEGDQVVLGEI